MDYEVIDMLDALDGHDTDRVMKIKLANGTILPIGGLEFRNACIGGDDIIYVSELNPKWVRYHEEVSHLIKHLYKIATDVNNAFEDGNLDETCWAGNMLLIIDEVCEEWFRTLGIKCKYAEPFADGTVESIFDKIKVLGDFCKSH